MADCYWKLDGGMRNAPSFPWFVIGRPLEFTMTFVNDTDTAWKHAYLFVEEENIGRVYAKLSSEEDYTPVSRANDPEAFLGELLPGEKSVDFRIVSMEGDEGVQYFGIPIYVGHDDGTFLPNYMFSREWDTGVLWADCYDQFPLWRDDYNRNPVPCSPNEIMAGAWLNDWTPVWFTDWAPVWEMEW
jgi:hypothetical protein